MRLKNLVVLVAMATLLPAMTSTALALQDPTTSGKGNIVAETYIKGNWNGLINQLDKRTLPDMGGETSTTQGPGTPGNMNYGQVLNSDKTQGLQTWLTYDGYNSSTHPQGTWNNPYTVGIDGFNYNDPQDYTEENGFGATTVTVSGVTRYTVGPHGNYLTSTHKCRECHAVHRAAGKFKLTRSDTRFEACDWCHGTGAGSGFNIQMDNDDAYTQEYNVGHTMGFGTSDSRWKAPDDTYPAFSPNYWLGGFSCFDCHSPHANPSRLLGSDANGNLVHGVANPGHEVDGSESNIIDSAKSIWQPGSWLLIKNPDREINTSGRDLTFYDVPGSLGVEFTVVSKDAEIGDTNTGVSNMYSDNSNPIERYPVNKVPTNWNTPIGLDSLNGESEDGDPIVKAFTVSEFCTDCHDGNAGLHTVGALSFSEGRVLHAAADESASPEWEESYELAYGHDSQPRQCSKEMIFNMEDGINSGPNCRKCHKGSSDCDACHSNVSYSDTIMGVDSSTASNIPFKWERTVIYPKNWRTSGDDLGEPGSPRYIAQSPESIGFLCADDGFSWPHRTLGWKMLKDDLFGVDFDGKPIGPGESRLVPDNKTTHLTGEDSTFDYNTTFINFLQTFNLAKPAHDMDSVCLDCHWEEVW